jgi:hypothetical protein
MLDAGGGATRSITYLAQCLALRGDDAGDEGTYPFIAQRYVEAARPDVQVTTRVIYYSYPYLDLEQKFEFAVRGHPDIIVIEIPASPVAWRAGTPLDLSRFPSAIRTAHQRFRYLRDLRGHLQVPQGVDRLVHIVDVNFRAALNGPLRRLVRRLPTPTLPEYESLVETTLARLAARTTATIVLAGPAGFTETGPGDGYVDGAVKAYASVNDMVRRIASRRGMAFVDRVAVAVEEGTSFFRPGSSIYYSASGHRTMGRFVGHTLLSHGLL